MGMASILEGPSTAEGMGRKINRALARLVYLRGSDILSLLGAVLFQPLHLKRVVASLISVGNKFHCAEVHLDKTGGREGD
jgi:hypothetical protein